MKVDFDKIIEDYKKIINTKYTIVLSDNVVIEFTFKGEHLPHLLGLNHLKDIHLLERYADKNDVEIGGQYIWNEIKDKGGKIDTSKLCESIHFEEIYENKLKYFDLSILLQPMKIIRFDPAKVDSFVPKINKVCYMFWEYFDENGKHGHFGIGFEVERDKHFPNTFFYRSNNDYIRGQEDVLAHSYLIKHPNKNTDFTIYWDNIRISLEGNSHYKYLKRNEEKIGVEVKTMTTALIEKIDDEEIKRHFRLLRLDEVKMAYMPHIDSANTWNNKIKEYLIKKIDGYEGHYLPHEIKSLLNEMPSEC